MVVTQRTYDLSGNRPISDDAEIFQKDEYEI